MTNASASGPATTLAAWSSGLRPDDIPEAVRARTADILLDAIASALAGRSSDEARMIERVARGMGEGDEATVIGGQPLSRAGAVLLNGYQVTASTVCDVYRPASCHVSPEIVPPALGVAERLGASGSALLTAVAIGLEVTTRVGRGIRFPAFRARGWHAPGVIGPFGGASAVAHLLGLDADRTRAALGLAGSQSAGTQAHYGTPTIKFHQSRGALSGYLAGTLAAEGFTSAEEIFANPDGGIFHAYSDGGDPDAVVRDLGTDWELEKIALRLWPAASSIQSVVGAGFDLVREFDLRPDQVRQLRVFLAPTPYERHGEMGWGTRFEALLSTRYCIAVTLHDRRCWLDQFEPDSLARADVDAFARERVAVAVDEGVTAEGARIEATLTDGSEISVTRDTPKGDASDPVTRDELIAKFRDASTGVLPEAQREEALELLIGIESVNDVRKLCRALRVAG
ncbi:MAG TPA: MmgE/PrpD family protein [Candidatus Limnocylindria bacterium]